MIIDAIKNNQVERVREILEFNNEEVSSEALIIAAMNENTRILGLLLNKKGINVDETRNDAEGDTALMVVSYLGQTSMVGYLLKRGANVNKRNKSGRTALMMACMQKQYRSCDDTVELLLKKHANSNLTENDRGWTALMIASMYGCTKRVKMLLGASRTNMFMKDKFGQTAYDLAKNREIKGLFLNSFQTELHSRIRLSHIVMLPECLDSSGVHVDLRNENGWTPLMTAASLGDVEIVELLLDYGANLDARDNDGKTALMHAVCGVRLEMIEILVERGADITIEDNRGRIPYDKMKEYEKVVNLLKK